MNLSATMVCSRCGSEIQDSHYSLRGEGSWQAVCFECWRRNKWWRRFTAWREYDRQGRQRFADRLLGVLHVRRVSAFDHMHEDLYAPWPGCVRCGGKRPDSLEWPAGTRHFWQQLNWSGLCLTCLDTMPPEGVFQWLLLKSAADIGFYRTDYGGRPIAYAPPHSQARYAHVTHDLERYRRILFEGPPAGYPMYGPDLLAQPQNAPEYIPYTACYLNGLAEPHSWHDIPALQLAICTQCHVWARLPNYERCEPWRIG